MGYFDRVTVSLHIVYTANQETEGSQDRLSVQNNDLGPVVRTPVSANLGLNFNLGFFFLLFKAVSRIIFSILFRVSNHQIVGKEN